MKTLNEKEVREYIKSLKINAITVEPLRNKPGKWIATTRQGEAYEIGIERFKMYCRRIDDED